MRSSLIQLAKVSQKAPPPLPKFFKDQDLTLRHFLIKGEVLSLYRQILRCTKALEKSQAKDIRDFARQDFERFRHERDYDKIRALLSSGKQQMHNLQTALNLAHAK
ncbi:hypothetical protein BCR43DRAFT_525214 [Syncephalastrum racemosum]|uniref:LYR motif-containing protein 2 n=1 Tax=Syncephalastrum racemosum TaxID=13706 RepID=A0A1X2HA11_SYNRA|nr:hypothetical protein BCR43DRAFT_525214 [Syncephalastrum racemosum]